MPVHRMLGGAVRGCVCGGPGEALELGYSLFPFLCLPPPVMHYCKKTFAQEHDVNLPCCSGSLVN